MSDKVQIPQNELTLSYSKSSGPGGQNVNTTNTKVTLKWNVQQSGCIDTSVKERFLARYANKINSAGDMVSGKISSSRACSQTALSAGRWISASGPPWAMPPRTIPPGG